MKNKLQEHFQRNKQELPKYNTMRIGGDDYNSIWKFKVLLLDGTIYKRGEYIKKRK
jgi:dsRNA-specific ribonuclease